MTFFDFLLSLFRRSPTPTPTPSSGGVRSGSVNIVTEDNTDIVTESLEIIVTEG